MPQADPVRDDAATSSLGLHMTRWTMVLAGYISPSVMAQEQPPPVTLSPVVVIGTNDWGPLSSAHWHSSITIVSGERLEAAGMTSLPELRRAVPNLAQSHGGRRSFGDNYVIRGLANTPFLSDPTVA